MIGAKARLDLPPLLRGSELMAMRTVSKTVNPGSSPGSPA